MIKKRMTLAIKNLKNVREKTGNSIMENFPAIKAPEKNIEDITIIFLSKIDFIDPRHVLLLFSFINGAS
jgi:hypothetical protein